MIEAQSKTKVEKTEVWVLVPDKLEQIDLVFNTKLEAQEYMVRHGVRGALLRAFWVNK